MTNRDWEKVDGKWLHRPWWKVGVNRVLRRFQRRRERKLVIATITTLVGDPPRVLGYKLAFVKHLPDPKEK